MPRIQNNLEQDTIPWSKKLTSYPGQRPLDDDCICQAVATGQCLLVVQRLRLDQPLLATLTLLAAVRHGPGRARVGAAAVDIGRRCLEWGSMGQAEQRWAYGFWEATR
jgi:hypothetical protein